MTPLLHLLALACAAAASEISEVPPPPSLADAAALTAALHRPHLTILRPDKDAPEWWAGAPSVLRDADGIFWMACRMRTADGPRGRRGYEIRLLRSDDGEHFETIHRIPREDLPIPGFERPALLIDPPTGNFKLYLCGPWNDGPWCILKLDDAPNPAQFNPKSARPVILPPEKKHERDHPPLEYKDPVILFAEGAWHAFLTGYVRQNERIFHFRSADGETWSPVGDPYAPIMPLSGWHDFFVRPASVLPIAAGYLFIYEGSRTSWHDPVYNIATGLAFTFDLHHLIDLTPAEPLAISTTPGRGYFTFRYSSWVPVNNGINVYAEVACADGTNEIRLFRINPQTPPCPK